MNSIMTRAVAPSNVMQPPKLSLYSSNAFVKYVPAKLFLNGFMRTRLDLPGSILSNSSVTYPCLDIGRQICSYS